MSRTNNITKSYRPRVPSNCPDDFAEALRPYLLHNLVDCFFNDANLVFDELYFLNQEAQLQGESI